jgi:hypothetical protein
MAGDDTGRHSSECGGAAVNRVQEQLYKRERAGYNADVQPENCSG